MRDFTSQQTISTDDQYRTKFCPCSPAAIKLGSLVRLDVSFVLFYNRRAKTSTLRPILRAIYLLDNTDCEASDPYMTSEHCSPYATNEACPPNRENLSGWPIKKYSTIEAKTFHSTGDELMVIKKWFEKAHAHM